MANQNKNKKSSTKKSRRSARKARAPLVQQKKLAVMLHECEKQYLRSMLDPFDPNIAGKVCYPSFPAKKSFKYVCSANIPVTIGTGGYGWIMMDFTPSNSTDAFWYTGATYTGGVGNTFDTGAIGVVAGRYAGPTAATAFTESGSPWNQFRLVACGAKFRYTGTELNRGGTCNFILNPQQIGLNNVLIGGSAVNTIAREHVTSFDYQTVVIPPMHEEDVEWKDADQIFPWSDGGGATAAPFAALVFIGTPGNTFTVRLIEHIEAAGLSFNDYGSLSHIGDQQFVQTVTTSATSSSYGKPLAGISYAKQFVRTLQEMADTPIVKTAAKYASELVFAYGARRLGIPPVPLLAARNAIEVD